MLGNTEDRRRRGRQRTKWLAVIINSMDMRLSKAPEMVKDRKPGVLQSMGRKESDTTEQLKNNPCQIGRLSIIRMSLLPKRSADSM